MNVGIAVILVTYVITINIIIIKAYLMDRDMSDVDRLLWMS